MKLEYGLLIMLVASVAVIGINHGKSTVSQPFETLAVKVVPADAIIASEPCKCN